MNPETLKKYLSNQCTDEERRQVNEWYQQLDFPSEEQFANSDEERLYRSIRSELESSQLERNEPQASVRPVVSIWNYIGRIAAVLLLGMGILYWMYQKPVTIAPDTPEALDTEVSFTNRQAKIISYLLPDSTVVWLHPGSELHYSQAFVKRAVRFSGEAFFDVKRDPAHPFMICSGDMRTKVLGTSFNVRAFEGDPTFKISVVTGSVQVSDAKKQEVVVLKPAEEVVFETKSKHLTVRQTKERGTDKELWQSASLVFDETPMAEVAGRLMGTFHVKIDFADPQLAQCRLKVDFTQQRLPEILDMIDTLLGSTYRLEGDRITFSGEGCR
nr:FecR domain-containing protein [uncultured Dyadobacter sp.]